ncbi:MAG: PKD domain-containing protein [Euryarchaeota archaeon]|nr:PKD domain-containing protein [Euryarchaeota archaeon]
MRALSAGLASLILVTAFAGCFADEAPEPAAETTDDGAEPSEDAGNATENTTAAPAVHVVVSDNGTALEALNGTYAATVGVNLTFDASGSTGDNLTFAWDFGDGNTSSEAVATYAFAVAGNATVTLVVADGAGATNETTLPFAVGASAPAGPAPGTFLEVLTLTDSGTYTAAVQTGAAASTSNPYWCVGATSGVSANKVITWAIPTVLANGTRVAVAEFDLKLTGGQTTVDQGLRLTDPAGKNTDVDAAPAGDNGEKLVSEGEFVGGTYKVGVYGCIAVNGTWSLTAKATLVAAE